VAEKYGTAFAKIEVRLALFRIVERARLKHVSPAAGKGQPVDSTYLLAATAGAYLLAGFVKGVIGLGLPTVAIGLLGLMMTPAQAAAILVVPSLVTNIWQFAMGGELIALARRMAPMLAGISVGTLIGAVFLPTASGGHAPFWLGVALAIYAGFGLIKMEFKVPPRAEIWLGPLIGVLTGAATVATGVFVLPGVPYIQALQFDRDRLVQALGLSFTVSTVTLALALAHAGEMKMPMAWPSLVALGTALIGMVVGQVVRGRVKPETFRVFFFLGLLVLGAHLMLREFL